MTLHILGHTTCKNITYLMEQSLFEKLASFSANQEIPRILWDPKVHCRVYKSRPPIPILSQNNPVNSPPPASRFLNIHLPIIVQCTPGSSKWSLSIRFPHQNSAHLLCPHTCYMTRPSHSYRLLRSLRSSLFSFLPCFLVPLRYKYCPQHPLIKKNLNVCSPSIVSDQVSHPYITTGEIINLYILIFKFLDSKLEDKRFCTEL